MGWVGIAHNKLGNHIQSLKIRLKLNSRQKPQRRNMKNRRKNQQKIFVEIIQIKIIILIFIFVRGDAREEKN